MHRDISCGNLLVLSRVPAQAVLHDFGKAIKAPQDHRTNLGPMFTLAPEVDGMTRYNNKIDIWSLAFSFCQIAFPRLLEGLHPHLRTTPAWLDQTLRHLKNFRDSNPSKEAAPIDLIIGMLARDPDLRLSATQALKHRCFASDSETSDQLLPRKASRLEPATTRSDRPDAAPRSSPAGSARAAGPTLRQEIHDTSTKHSPSRTHYGPASPVEQEAHGLPGRLLSNSGRIPQPMTLNDRSNPSSRHQLPIDGRSPGPSPSQNPSDTAQRDRTPPRSPPNLCHVSQQTHDDNLSSDLAPTERFNQPPISSSEDSAPWIPEAERRRRSAATHADPWAYRIPKHQR